MTKKICDVCANKNPAVETLYDYSICPDCRTSLGLLRDKTIESHIDSKKYPSKKDYEKEIDRRLELIETEYLQKRIKLLHIKERLEHID